MKKDYSKISPGAREKLEAAGRLALDKTRNVVHSWRMSTTLSIRLPDDLARWVEDQAKATGRSRGSLVKEAIERARQAKTKPFMSLAGALDGPTDLSERKGFARS